MAQAANWAEEFVGEEPGRTSDQWASELVHERANMPVRNDDVRWAKDYLAITEPKTW